MIKILRLQKKINEYIETICHFNNNDKLKINLKKILVNYKLHDIKVLIFKIISDKKKI